MWLNVCSWVTTGLLTPCGSLISLPRDIIYFLPLPVSSVILLLCVIPWSLVGEHLECTSVCGHVHVAARAQSLMTFPKCFPPHLQTPSFTGLELTDLLRWMTSKPQGFPLCLPPPHWDYKHALSCFLFFFSFFLVGSGDQSQVLCFYKSVMDPSSQPLIALIAWSLNLWDLVCIQGLVCRLSTCKFFLMV